MSDLTEEMNDLTEEQYIEHLLKGRANAINGFIKLKLAHTKETTLLVPDLLTVDLDGMHWFQPKFFYAPVLLFWDSYAAADIRIEVTGGQLLRVSFTSGGLVATLSDGSQLYRCLISGPSDLAQSADGTCKLLQNGEIQLDLFHHTTTQAAEAIMSSGHFRGSNWNVQGTRKLKNIAYAYFTNLRSITSEEDLAKVAMSSSGYIRLLRTNAASVNEAIGLKVYRQSTMDRTATVSVSVAASLVAPQHIYRHAPRGGCVYYEACNPHIYRIGLQPEKVASFEHGTVNLPETDRKRFEYMVLGDADTTEGLVAPFDEEETQSLLHIEACEQQSFFEFWISNANSNQVDGRFPEMLIFED